MACEVQMVPETAAASEVLTRGIGGRTEPVVVPAPLLVAEHLVRLGHLLEHDLTDKLLG